MSSMGRFVAFLRQYSSETTGQMRGWAAFWNSLALVRWKPRNGLWHHTERVRHLFQGLGGGCMVLQSSITITECKSWIFSVFILVASLTDRLFSDQPPSVWTASRKRAPVDGVYSCSILGWRQPCSTGVLPISTSTVLLTADWSNSVIGSCLSKVTKLCEIELGLCFPGSLFLLCDMSFLDVLIYWHNFH